ncbi:MAG TPA: DUF3348 family protein [Ramlibacter sp.]|uniref:DUF3348 family protein n=1 Tax=Ramlibacter sp. TaxID=1917967 RepID=UPI002D72BFCE|nr:DUF3348 family protein [Ramlibacter sp.]HZY18809.1 DUF3348 family protein [Ramlibacter sp.]
MRSSFTSSRLVRLLADWSALPAGEAAGSCADAAAGMDFAERLSLWLNAFDAIELQAAHQSIRAIGAGSARPSPVRPLRPNAVGEDVQRVRGALAHAIAQDPLAEHAGPGEPGSTHAPYRRRHLELQRQMEQMVGALRDHVRQAIGHASPRLRQLAALDAVLEQVLSRREQLLLPAAAAMTERRFEHLRQAHRRALEASGQPDDPARWRAPGGWLDTFDQDWRQTLLAELELRLEPVVGLVEALNNESTDRT